MNIKHVLVPVDFSPPSRMAVNHGIALARKFRATLTLMHVIESGSGLRYPFMHENAMIARRHRGQAERMLGALVGSEEQDDLDLRIVVKSGHIKEEIGVVIREQHADILVMGTHSRSFFSRWVIGSVTEEILRMMPIPVLTVSCATKPLAFDRILFATDLSEASKGGFDAALELARTLRSTLIVAHVLDQAALTYVGADMVCYISENDIKAAKAKLATLKLAATRANVQTETVLAQGGAAEEILRCAEREVADLILVGFGKKGLVERTFLGTTLERVIREATVPVLSIPVVTPATPDPIEAEVHSA